MRLYSDSSDAAAQAAAGAALAAMLQGARGGSERAAWQSALVRAGLPATLIGVLCAPGASAPRKAVSVLTSSHTPAHEAVVPVVCHRKPHVGCADFSVFMQFSCTCQHVWVWVEERTRLFQTSQATWFLFS